MVNVKKRSRKKSSDLRNWQTWLFVIPPFGFMLFSLFWPVMYMLFLSLTKWDGIGTIEFIAFNNYVRILNDNRVWLALSNNIRWSIGALTIPPALGLFLAILLTQTKSFIARNVLRVIYFLPQIIAVAITAIIWRWIYAPSGPINTIFGAIGLPSNIQWLANSNFALSAVFVAYVWAATGFSMLIFEAAIVCIDPSMLECARIDGANWIQEIFYILIPMLKQAIITVITVTAIWSFQIFDLIYLTTSGGPGDSTMVLSLLIYNSTFRSRDVGRSSAMSVLLLIVVLVLASILFRFNKKTESESCS
jgi:ABC-type sugar transport system permease subunit